MNKIKSQLAWTPEEDAIVKANYRAMGPTALEPFLPDRHRLTIAARAAKLGVTKNNKPAYQYVHSIDHVAPVWRQWARTGGPANLVAKIAA